MTWKAPLLINKGIGVSPITNFFVTSAKPDGGVKLRKHFPNILQIGS
jgi:hypothetical protein